MYFSCLWWRATLRRGLGKTSNPRQSRPDTGGPFSQPAANWKEMRPSRGEKSRCEKNVLCAWSSRHQRWGINNTIIMKGIFCVPITDCVYNWQADSPLFGQKDRETQELCKLLCSQRAFFRHLQARWRRWGRRQKPSMHMHTLHMRSK